MTPCFADTFYYLALLNPDDQAHEKVLSFTQGFNRRIVTTDWIFTEVGDAMAGLRNRSRFLSFLDFVRQSPNTQIVRVDPQLFDEGLELYRRRQDKEWPLTDCISFVVMRQMKIVDALTADRHFEQAGFKALLK